MVSDDFFIRFGVFVLGRSNSGEIFLVVPVENNAGSTYDIFVK